MNRNENSILQQSNSMNERNALPVPQIKRLRSKIPRRRRFQISPILSGSSNSLVHDSKPESSVFQATSSCSSCFPDEISCTSKLRRIVPENIVKNKRSVRRKRGLEEIRSFRDAFRADERNSLNTTKRFAGEDRRPMTRSYLKLKEGQGDFGLELSESSCVESSSAAAAAAQRLCKSNLLPEKDEQTVEEGRKTEEIDEAEASAAVSFSEMSCIQQENVVESGEFVVKALNLETENENEGSVVSLFDSVSEFKTQPIDTENYDLDYNLACSERISYENVSEYSTSDELTLSQIELEIFRRNSDSEFSDLSPSLLIGTPSDYTDDESDENSTPPAYFSLFLEYAKEFSELQTPPDTGTSAKIQQEFTDDFTFMRLEDEENEESYQRLKEREKQLVLYDYAEDYCISTDCGDLVLQQRSEMVNWIIQQSDLGKLHNETMFLAVSLYDRFLAQGFFRSRRNLQVLGIACLTLATRIEENQPTNCVRQSIFRVGGDVYNRCEVVAMEWLVQKVLKFQCFMPTTYNFLWFYLKAAKADKEMEKRAKYLAVLSLLDHEQLCYWPSTVAAGLVILASLADNQDTASQCVMETHVRTKNDDLPECIQSLEWLLNYV